MNQRSKLFFRRPFSYSFNRATLFIILINCTLFALCYLIPGFYERLHYYASLNVLLVDQGHFYWQFFTYMFVHQNISHVFFNMFGLLVFGLALERAIGSKEFVLFYLVCGTLDGIFSYLVYKFTGQYRVFLMGASGAIYAVLFAYAVFFPRSIIYIWGIIPIPAPVLVAIYAVIEVASQFFSSSNVAHFTHLFGFLSAWLYFVIRMGIHPLKIWKNTFKRQ
ncbi:MAG: rhomboid family intramembrane serine protease [Treponema sp.]|nr:rhomboid family intramembrane serine protease [Treponema sp.]